MSRPACAENCSLLISMSAASLGVREVEREAASEFLGHFPDRALLCTLPGDMVGKAAVDEVEADDRLGAAIGGDLLALTRQQAIIRAERQGSASCRFGAAQARLANAFPQCHFEIIDRITGLATWIEQIAQLVVQHLSAAVGDRTDGNAGKACGSIFCSRCQVAGGAVERAYHAAADSERTTCSCQGDNELAPGANYQRKGPYRCADARLTRAGGTRGCGSSPRPRH